MLAACGYKGFSEASDLHSFTIKFGQVLKQAAKRREEIAISKLYHNLIFSYLSRAKLNPSHPHGRPSLQIMFPTGVYKIADSELNYATPVHIVMRKGSKPNLFLKGRGPIQELDETTRIKLDRLQFEAYTKLINDFAFKKKKEGSGN